MARTENVKTPLARIAFADNLFKAQKRDNGKEQYSATLLFPKGAPVICKGAGAAGRLISLEDLVNEAAVAEWGDKAIGMIKDGLIKTPFLDGDGTQGKNKSTGVPHKGFPGTVFVRVISGTDFPPKLITKAAQLGATKEDIYSGAYVYAVINAFTWENKEKGKGISIGVSMVQAVKDGERLGGTGGADVDDFIEVIADEGDAPAEAKTGAGAGGLFS